MTLLEMVTSTKKVEDVQKEHNIDVLKERIEEDGANSAFWNTFDSYARVINDPEWDQALEMMPDSVKEIANDNGFESNLDWEFWGSSDFFGLQFDTQNLSEEEQQAIDDWYEDDYDSYCKAISLIEKGMWRITTEDIEYQDFCIALK